jgi:hypothetical protein
LFTFVYFLDSNKYSFYKSGFEIKYKLDLFGRNKIFPYENIISVEFRSYKGDQFLLITFLDGDKIKSCSSPVRLETKQNEEMVKILRENKVTVKQ